MKNLAILAIIVFLSTTASSFAAFTVNNDDSETISEDQIGYGISIAKEFEIERNIFTDNGKDYIFNEIGVFGNQYDDIIDRNYGAEYSFGYGYGKFSSYVTGGYVMTDFEYGLEDDLKEYSEGAGFFGAGISYKIVKHLKIKLDFMNYKFNFSPDPLDSSQDTEIAIQSFGLGLQLYF